MNERIVGLIPARMGSTRFPGKALATICGKPMIYWVYIQAKKVNEISDVYIVTEDIEIYECCKQIGINCYLGKKRQIQVQKLFLMRQEKLRVTSF